MTAVHFPESQRTELPKYAKYACQNQNSALGSESNFRFYGPDSHNKKFCSEIKVQICYP